MKNKRWQITLLVEDDMNDASIPLTKNSIEAGYRFNRQPQFLKLLDVEAIDLSLVRKPPAAVTEQAVDKVQKKG